MPAVDATPLPDLLNQTLRRLKQYQTELEWIAALLDAAAHFTAAAAVFAVEKTQLRLCGQHRLQLADGLTIPANLGRAIETAIHTKDTVVALRTPGEVTPHLSSADPAERAVLIPILNTSRVAAVLFAVTNMAGHTAALELIAGLASLVLERAANSPATVQISPVPASPDPPKTAPLQTLPIWSGLDEEQRRLHTRARRFSRVKVAEMQLFQPDACRAGREQNNIYLFLKKEIDSARESYRDQFMARPGMEDYLHLELIRTAAGGDENTLGVDYPGNLG